MNGTKAAIHKAKAVATKASNGSTGTKRRKGQDLKPINTDQDDSESSSPSSSNVSQRYVVLPVTAVFQKGR
jgi:serine/threonine-protein kinase SRPK3